MKFRAQRYPTRYPVKLKVGLVAHPSMITSVSVSGICLAVEQDIPVGQDVVVDCQAGQLRGKVKWSSEDKVGVKFGRPLSRAELERIRFGIQASATARRPKIGFTELR